MKKYLPVALTGLLLLAWPAAGQQEKGDSELQLQGSLTVGGDVDTGSVFLTWGRFLTRTQELGVSVAGFFDSSGDLFGVGGPFWRINLGSGKTVPYLGVAAFADFGGFTSGDVVINAEAGVRWFLQRNMAFTVAGSTFYDLDASEFDDRVQILFGFSYFRKK